jgi:transglutaminase-like putative cysteine protease
MFGTLATWVPVLFLVTLAAKFWLEPRGYRLRFPIVKVVLAGLMLVAVLFSYGSVKGIEPGVSLIVILMALKILEAHTAREFQVMVMVAWVLCLCGFFLAQDLAIALCLLVAFTLLLVALIQFHRGAAPGAFWPPLRTACKILAQALPLIVLLFFLFPRISTGFRFLIEPRGSAVAGFTDHLSPGSVATLAGSSDIAFRAEFPDGNVPPANGRYWRGVVMTRGEGFEWRAAENPASIPRQLQRAPEGEPIRQWITIEPHGEHWMFALDWPAESPSGATLAPGNYLWSWQPLRKPRRYEAKSFGALREKELRPRELPRLLDVPAWLSPATRELVKSWTDANPDPRSVVASALQFFRTSGFRYSLSPGEYKKNELDEFLFRRRLGFCEHYAASFATLMRAAGIPARVVVGYLGGEYNEFGNFFVIRQADTHAWCEVWLAENGWTRIDPTSVVAPDRVNLGLDSFLERRSAAGERDARTFARNFAQRPVFAQLRVAWDTLSYAWDTRVLSFDAEAQESFVSDFGVTTLRPFSLITYVVVIVALVVAAYTAWMRWRSRSGIDRVKLLYERFCRKAAGLGVQREASEGPAHFSNRASHLLPDKSERIRRISDAYIALRYGDDTSPILLHDLTNEVKAFGTSDERSNTA